MAKYFYITSTLIFSIKNVFWQSLLIIVLNIERWKIFWEANLDLTMDTLQCLKHNLTTWRNNLNYNNLYLIIDTIHECLKHINVKKCFYITLNVFFILFWVLYAYVLLWHSINNSLQLHGKLHFGGHFGCYKSSHLGLKVFW